MNPFIILIIIALITFAFLPSLLQKLGQSNSNSIWISLAVIAAEVVIFFLI